MQMVKGNCSASMTRAVVFALLGILVSACATDQHYWAQPLDAAGIQESRSVNCIDNEVLLASRDALAVVELTRRDPDNASEKLFTEMTVAAVIGEIAYCDAMEGEEEEKIQAALSDFGALSYNAAYLRPRFSSLTTFPSIYLLSKPSSHRIIVYFPGVDAAAGPADLLQSLKAGAAEDQPVAGQPYIPRGHEGFREGIANLINDGFFLQAKSLAELEEECSQSATSDRAPDRKTVSLAGFICTYDVADPTRSDPIELVVAGHSLGAGVAQSALGAFNGMTWIREPAGGWAVAAPERNWPFRVRAAYLYSPPLALYPRDEGCNWVSGGAVNPIDVYTVHGLTDLTYSIIKEGDPVPNLWRPGGPSINCVEGNHFGKMVSIPRGEEPDIAARTPVTIKWDNPFPHRLQSYRKALANALRRTQDDRPGAKDEKIPGPKGGY